MKKEKDIYSLQISIFLLLITILPLVGWFVYMGITIPKPYGKELWISVTINIILLGLIWMVSNKMAAQYRMLEETNRQLSELDRLKTEFLANVSHELRTPLTVIMGYSELLTERLSQKEGEEADLKFVQTIHRKSEDLLNLINDLIELSRIESGKVEMRMAYISLDEIIRETVDELRTNADKKNHTLEVLTQESPLKLYADSGKIKQIVSNLVQNAIKYTPAGGRIVVRAYIKNGTCFVEVEDNGIGISEENLHRIYQPFKQVDSSYNKKYEGFGLGLAITKSLVQYHRGTIDTRSVVGEGSTFIVSFPIEGGK
ncbi:sensor histidine kinase [Aneurinibacillus tyrosinisolvens]|uniref:sensor histidine kinase n=1 Tax=Aneurinibacillus tyrosinisolvens TaxID=1443435 RepID=UPI00069B3DB8|nr:ATP-binding protein [Aneurinibacillus tyrosinisolvens]